MRRRSSRLAFGRPTGNDVSGQWPQKTTLFSFLFSLSSTFLIEGVLESKNLDLFPDPVGHFWAPWQSFWILQAVRGCRQWASAPMPLSLCLTLKLYPCFINQQTPMVFVVAYKI